ncbi:MAG TPA: NUDIX domain-containing protein [Burkholderiales bacterium]|nr:NUDIX domain-containing protein [Burkholderiales bacterium]
MPRRSAGILLYRINGHAPEVFLVHPGGPYWTKKDAGAWSIPKGEIDKDEDPLAAAKREFGEETGSPVSGEFIPLRPCRQAGGKVVHAWAVEGDIDADAIRSNLFSMEWPPRSGNEQEFPEADRGGWFSFARAREKLLAAQHGFLDQLEQMLELRLAGRS